MLSNQAIQAKLTKDNNYDSTTGLGYATNTSGTSNDQLLNIENIIGSEHNDNITGNLKR